jgi:hypothetical protein
MVLVLLIMLVLVLVVLKGRTQKEQHPTQTLEHRAEQGAAGATPNRKMDPVPARWVHWGSTTRQSGR